jgi:hypothetical protein
VTRWEPKICGVFKRSCKHDWAIHWPDEGEPLERQCTKCLQLEQGVDEDGLFLDQAVGYN